MKVYDINCYGCSELCHYIHVIEPFDLDTGKYKIMVDCGNCGCRNHMTITIGGVYRTKNGTSKFLGPNPGWWWQTIKEESKPVSPPTISRPQAPWRLT